MKRGIALLLALLVLPLLLAQTGCGISALQGSEEASALPDPQQDLTRHVSQLRDNQVMFERRVHG